MIKYFYIFIQVVSLTDNQKHYVDALCWIMAIGRESKIRQTISVISQGPLIHICIVSASMNFI